MLGRLLLWLLLRLLLLLLLLLLRFFCLLLSTKLTNWSLVLVCGRAGCCRLLLPPRPVGLLLVLANPPNALCPHFCS